MVRSLTSACVIPPFFETMEEAGLNPKTSFGGTPEEMVCPGGEKAFITRIIEDSAVLKESFRCFLINHFCYYSYPTCPRTQF